MIRPAAKGRKEPAATGERRLVGISDGRCLAPLITHSVLHIFGRRAAATSWSD